MDRQRNAETTKRLDDKILQKALGVITQSYQGVPPEKLFNEAIHCFDALIDISLQTENIRDFAQRKHLDNKYIVDGANFVISKMHFNTGSNHYITLGLPSTASSEMIRERWKRLMLLYHPDRQPGAEEWVSERAKKVNEAYNTLKDEEKRNVYDRELSEPSPDISFSSHPKMRRRVSRRDSHILPLSPGWVKIRSYLPKALVGVYIIVAMVFIWFIYMQNRSPHLETALQQDESQSAKRIQPTLSSSGGQEAQSNDNQETLAVSPEPQSAEQHTGTGIETDTKEEAGADLKAGIGTGKEKVSSLRQAQPSHTQYGESSKDKTKVKDSPSQTDPQERISSKEEAKAGTQQKTPRADRIQPTIAPSGEQMAISDESAEELGRLRRAQPSRKQNGTSSKSIATKSPAKIKPSAVNTKPTTDESSDKMADAKIDILKVIESPLTDVPAMKSESPLAKDVIEKRRQTATAPAENKTEDVRKAVAGLQSDKYARPRPEHTITRQEVEAFMKGYIEAYKKSDIDLFMSFFSVSAIENNILTYQEIRKRYQAAFRNEIESYDINKMNIEIVPPDAHVSGLFVITQFITSENLWTRFRGNIRWKIT